MTSNRRSEPDTGYQASLIGGAGSMRTESTVASGPKRPARCDFASAAASSSAHVTSRCPSLSYNHQRRTIVPSGRLVTACSIVTFSEDRRGNTERSSLLAFFDASSWSFWRTGRKE